MVRLEAASAVLPCGLRELLDDLGDGESGFGGTPVSTGETSLEAYVRQCCDMSDPANVPSGLVPQTTFWVLDADGLAVGMVRLRHCLNDKLYFHGGHIGYFIRRDKRGRDYAKAALRLALLELRQLGERRALLTADPANVPSIRVIEGSGGQLENTVTDPETGKVYRRYWIELNA